MVTLFVRLSVVMLQLDLFDHLVFGKRVLPAFSRDGRITPAGVAFRLPGRDSRQQGRKRPQHPAAAYKAHKSMMHKTTPPN